MADAHDGNRVGFQGNKHPRWLTAKTPTHDAEYTTQAERFAWLSLRRVDDVRGGSPWFVGRRVTIVDPQWLWAACNARPLLCGDSRRVTMGKPASVRGNLSVQ
ncbi:MAG: hypothetical protein E6J34_19450 [Chloroflexi bacterium]|nr:MAG: hypothetical protein E6J34_19450 [Chloroflexota bacterium]